MSSSLRATGSEDIIWLIGAVVCLCAAPRVTPATDGLIMCCCIVSSCQSAANFEVVLVKRFWSKSVGYSKYRIFTFHLIDVCVDLYRLSPSRSSRKKILSRSVESDGTELN